MDWKINYIIIRIYTPVFKVSIIYVNALQPTESSNFKIEVGTVFAEFFSETEALCKKDSSVGDKFRSYWYLNKGQCGLSNVMKVGA